MSVPDKVAVIYLNAKMAEITQSIKRIESLSGDEFRYEIDRLYRSVDKMEEMVRRLDALS